MTTWPIELVDELRALADGTRTSYQIADALGVTRNTIVGKCRRLGLPLSYQGKPKPKSVRRGVIPRFLPNAKTPRPAPEPVAAPEPIAAWPEPIETPLGLDVPLSTSRPCTLVRLTATSCRWPLGDPCETAFRFCGAVKALDGKPYCEAHQRLSRIPTRAAPQVETRGAKISPMFGGARVIECEDVSA